MEFATRLTLAAAFAASVAAAPVLAAETPKRGGTLTYMIAADAPPSFDGHREQTFATDPPGRAVLQRADPHQSGEPVLLDRFRVRSMHRNAEADRRRQDLHLQDPRQGVKFHDGTPLTAADVAASWNRIVFPPEGVTSARAANYQAADREDREPRPGRRSSSA